jgi:hypothetical protein
MKMTNNRKDEIANKVYDLLNEILTSDEKSEYVDKVRSIACDVLADSIKRAMIVEEQTIEPINTDDWAFAKDSICAFSLRTAHNYRHPTRSTRAKNAVMAKIHNLIGNWS